MATTDTSTESLASWRQAQFMGMGFNMDQSAELAAAVESTYVKTKTGFRLYTMPLNYHRVRHVLDNGCPMDLALAIFL